MNRYLLPFLLILVISHHSTAQSNSYTVPQKIICADCSLFAELSPIFNAVNSELFFVRLMTNTKKKGNWNQDIYRAKLNINNWSLDDLKSINELNNQKNNAVAGISYDGQHIYLLNSYTKNHGVAHTKFDTDVCNSPKEIVISGLEIKNKNYGYYIHPDEKTIVFSYEGPNSLGKEDLYWSNFENGTWTKPIHLGNQINTVGYEISPFLSLNKDTLYFSSNGQNETFGGTDIYYSILDKDGQWSKPKNMGSGINSSFFDAYLIQIGKTFVWSSTRDSSNFDLYFCSLTEKVSLQASFEKKDVSKFNGSDGQILLTSIIGTPPYKFEWSNGVLFKDNYQLKSGNYSLKITDSLGNIFRENFLIKQPELKINETINIPEIRYKSDSWEFINDTNFSSLDSLNKIADILNSNSGLVIRLISHTDSRGDENRNLILSENRSRACFKYLVENKGIDARRIIPIGMGENQPALVYDEQKGKIVEISEEYINSFKNNTTIIDRMHQLNRRTEGIVDRLNFSEKDPPTLKMYFQYIKP